MDEPPERNRNLTAGTPRFSLKNFRREYDEDDDVDDFADNKTHNQDDVPGAVCGFSETAASAHATDSSNAPSTENDHPGDDIADLNDDPGALFLFSANAGAVHDTDLNKARVTNNTLTNNEEEEDKVQENNADMDNDSPDSPFGFRPAAAAADPSAEDLSRAPFPDHDVDVRNVDPNSADLNNEMPGAFFGFSAAAAAHSGAAFRRAAFQDHADDEKVDENNADIENDILAGAAGFAAAAAAAADFDAALFPGDNENGDNVNDKEIPGGDFNLAAAFAAARAMGFNTPQFPGNDVEDESDSDEEDVYKKRFHSSPSSSLGVSKFFSEVGNIETVRRRARYVQSEHSDEYYSDGDGEQENIDTFNDAESYGANSEDFDNEMEGWKSLPVILLEDIFAMLSPKQRHQASMVCRPWYEIFYSPRVWETFVLFERTLTKRRFNLYKGYQRELCPRKTQICLMRVGCFFKRIIITPISDYYNLYEFLRVLSAFLTFYAEFPMPLLHTFRFTFACESRGVNGVIIIGTGGNILEKLKDLVSSMQELRHLALNELLLDVEEVSGLLAAAATQCTDSLTYLELLNCSKVPMPICEVCHFSQLLTLKLSPQHLSEEVVLLLGGTQLLHLHIVQDAYTCACDPVSSEAWKLFKDMAPAKRVFLEIQGLTKTPLLLQPHAPVRGVVFRTFYHRLQPELTTWLVEYYGKFLEYFVQECLPRAHGSRKFCERADESLLRLVRGCPRLHTLVIRERLSLATLLLVAKEGKALKSLMVRRNALIKKCEWPRAKNWTEDFYRWLRRHGRDYDLAFQQLPLLLKQRWKPATDKVFKHTRVHVT